jgi:hypothetical protein
MEFRFKIDIWLYLSTRIPALVIILFPIEDVKRCQINLVKIIMNLS